MAVEHRCENKACAEVYKVEEAPTYCPKCEGILREWNDHFHRRSSEMAMEFTESMDGERDKFFAKRTPKRNA